MNATRIEVPLALRPPHFDDERTIATARQVKPIGRAKVTESWRKLRTLLPLILLATVCGALGAASVNYYENRHTVNAVAQPSTNNFTAEPKVEASPIAVAASAVPTPSVDEKTKDAVAVKNEVTPTDQPETKIVTEPARIESSDKPAANAEKKATDADATKLTRKRRVNSLEPDGASSNKKGAGRISDIFSGPNPF
jgi:cytoskeletal protein RodZ